MVNFSFNGHASLIMRMSAAICLLVVATHEASSAEVSGSNWMSYMPDIEISRLSIPGTHDSAARKFSDFVTPNSAVITQTLTIREQLDAGVRYLDIRCRHIENRCDVYHGNVYLLLGMNDVLKDVYSFLDDNPSETVIMSVKQPEHSDSNKEDAGFDATMSKYINSADKRKYWYTKNSMPILCKGDIGRYEEQKCARGKIVLLRRFQSGSELGIDATNWPDNATGISKSANIYLQDYYNLGVFFIRPDAYPDKFNKIVDLWNIAKSDIGTYLYLNYTSGVAFNKLGVPRIDGVSSYINPRVSRFFDANKVGHFGVTVMDFMTNDLARKIYKTNFRLLSNTDTDNDGISNLAEISQGGDPYTKMYVLGSDPIINLPVNVALSSSGNYVAFATDNLSSSYKADRLPPGLSINRVTGALEGTPIKSGRYAATVMARTGSGKVISKVWSLFIESLPEVEYDSRLIIKEGSQFSARAKAGKNSRPIFEVTEGELPPGLALDSYKGYIKGIPRNLMKAEYTVAISASNSAGKSVSRIIFEVH
jgi:1-phosphatidylinositol phosphodiesterase